jgi:RNA polymerase-binding transcription factor DksA
MDTMDISRREETISEVNERPAGVLCEGCGDLIPEARLRRVPHARNCIECQRELEIRLTRRLMRA